MDDFQVHGHEVQCLAALAHGGFVSGAEEKILRFPPFSRFENSNSMMMRRVFEMPRTVAESLREVAGQEAVEREEVGSQFSDSHISSAEDFSESISNGYFFALVSEVREFLQLRPLDELPWGAAVPALGLSNGAVDREEGQPGGSGDTVS